MWACAADLAKFGRGRQASLAGLDKLMKIPTGGRQGRPQKVKPGRDERLTRALRDNLKRRKGQAQDRDKNGPERPTLIKPGGYR